MVKINPEYLQAPKKAVEAKLPHKAVTFCKMFEVIEQLKVEKTELYRHLEEQVQLQLKNNTIGFESHLREKKTNYLLKYFQFLLRLLIKQQIINSNTSSNKLDKFKDIFSRPTTLSI